ncbi:nucleoside triphosphate pyrophosphohydrolase [Deinococcus cellulosilyticus]|uniref:Phosphoribosyl-ATP pyrophosphohydrolase n=1 Tax=Deinococcus cellulosilyticus (strain DSM 18568 / NBRC 106333 / KACC 11606 / 5516J-15) TaxID=1223518 RepID=A0A511N6U7_DEIC1|nr:nucleoside triphosphate pyrophosphohydrolase [Deinococcus cellulosilyticus]GEM48574.1 hypothetical protein DC3_42090 [Deinococcus cellulosilyticus NBRC 106333 = KACC 11606]
MKLVRDHAREQHSEAHFERLSEEDFPRYLRLKLQEEVQEYLAQSSAEELADILEVVYALAELQGIQKDNLEALREVKAREQGTFRERLALVRKEPTHG